MIDCLAESRCTGCCMCADACPTGAIKMEADMEGFWHPVINYQICTRCERCSRKCPVLSKLVKKNEYPMQAYASWSLDPQIREFSTSGGIYSELASEWMKGSGVCCGAVYDDADQHVKHVVYEDCLGIAHLRQSKYVQSDTKGIYTLTMQYLREGRDVLFCGTPCHVAAMKSFLPQDLAGSILYVDFICCGVTSPYAYQKYINWLENRYQSKIVKIQFKNKERGWRSIGTKIEFSNGRTYHRDGKTDPFMIAYIEKGLTLRPSCHQCEFKSIPHVSDIMLGDFWGIEQTHPDIPDNDKGISCVVINSKKGEEFFWSILPRLAVYRSSIDNIRAGNRQLTESHHSGEYRNEFLSSLRAITYGDAIKKYGSYSGFKKVSRQAKSIVKQILRITVKKFLKNQIRGKENSNGIQVSDKESN